MQAVFNFDLNSESERQRAEQKLAEASNFIKTMLRASPVAILTYKASGECVWANEAAARIVGGTVEQLQAQNFRHLESWRRSGMLAAAETALVRGQEGRLETQVLTTFGKEIWIVCHFAAFQHEGQTHLLAVLADVTDRKSAEEAIRKSEASLALAQRVAHLGSWEVDLVRDTLEWSAETFRIFGLSPGGFTPSNEAFFTLIPIRDRPQVRAAAQAAIATGQPYSIDHAIVLPDGSERIVKECADVLFDSQGTPVRMVGTVQDITKLKQIEQALQRSEKHFRSLIENALDLITIVDAQSRIHFQSPSSQRVLGYAPEQLASRSAFDFIHPDDLAQVKAALQHALAHGDLPTMTEFRFRHADGSWRHLESIGRRLQGEEPPLVVVNSRDMTERRQLEEEFRQAQKMEAFGQLAGGVAHDFNNMLAAIQMSSALLLGAHNLSTEAAALTKQIAEAAERAASLTRQLLLFSRKHVLQPVNLDLNVVVANMTTMLRRILGEDITLLSEYAPNLPCLRADTGMIEQVLLNLAVNARDAMPRGGRLTITTAACLPGSESLQQHPDASPGQYICLSVSDTGCGIPPQVLPRIFEPFFTTKEVGKGTGLGLATVYGIVRQHHGWIEVESTVGQGTTFRILLPATDDAKPLADDPSLSLELPKGTGGILLVEDEAALRVLMTKVLQRCGYTVFSASSGVAALEVWGAQKPAIQVLLTDLVMPEGMSGRELAGRLKAENPQLKIIYTSGYSPELLGNVSGLVEGVNFLPKPYPPLQLAKMVHHCLAQPEAG